MVTIRTSIPPRLTFNALKSPLPAESIEGGIIIHKLTIARSTFGPGFSMTAKPPPDPALLELFRAELETHLGDPERRAAIAGEVAQRREAAGVADAGGPLDQGRRENRRLRRGGSGLAPSGGLLRRRPTRAADLTSDNMDVLLRGVDALNRLGSTPELANEENGLTETALEQLIGRDRRRSCRPAAGVADDGPPSPSPPRRSGFRRNSASGSRRLIERRRSSRTKRRQSL